MPALPGASPSAAAPLPPRDDVLDQNQQDHKQSFINQLQIPRSTVPHPCRRRDPPFRSWRGRSSRWPLVTGINSDLPGEIIGNGHAERLRHRVRPISAGSPGSRLLGQYDSQVTYGQRRVLLVLDAALDAGRLIHCARAIARGRWMRWYSGVEDGRELALGTYFRQVPR